MIPGLPQGYVRLDSVACRILRALHRGLPMDSLELAEELHDEERTVCNTLRLLIKAKGFIHKYDRALKYETGRTTRWQYSLAKPTKPPRPPASASERQRLQVQRRYRARVGSVFAIGKIQL